VCIQSFDGDVGFCGEDRGADGGKQEGCIGGEEHELKESSNIKEKEKQNIGNSHWFR
jgi:hypothetical protein